MFGRISNLNGMKKLIGQWSLSFGGVACIICWIVLFSAGLFVDTKPFRDQLAKGFNLGDLFRVCVCYTPTNAALLTCLAGLCRRHFQPPYVQPLCGRSGGHWCE